MKWMFRPIRLFFMVQVRDISYLCGECVVNDYNARYYLPWALMKCKRYLYANMEVNGQRFLMGLPVGMFLLVVSFCFFLFRNLNDSVSRYAACWLYFDFVTVGFAYIYAAKGLRYQALMTSLNGVRFSFNCS
ncbi:inner membrane protein [Escherichia coli]|uniref:Inner membrane protein n=1 Tax=Escherichia coli TaxID=562 RepID=A0A485JKQ5_ECOLX|nr:inner membrane protein [Escherichia coli]